MQIAIVGGAGFIGSNLASKLLEIGHSVTVFDNFSTGTRENLESLHVDVVEGDITSSKDIKYFFESNNFDFCYHLAALGSVPRSIVDPRSSFDANVIGTFNLLEQIRVKRIPLVYTSSSSVYGSNPKLPKEEMDWQIPISPYGGFKAANEDMLQAYAQAYNLKIIIFRLFNVYGPHQNSQGAYSAVIPRWISAALRGNSIEVEGDGEQKRDFTFVSDVAEVLKLATDIDIEVKGPINLAFGRPVTLNEILKILSGVFQDLRVEFRDSRKGDIKNSESNPKKLYEVIGPYTPKSIKEGIAETITWYKKNMETRSERNYEITTED